MSDEKKQLNLHRLFTYGTLKRGFGNNRLLERSKFLEEATVTGQMRSLGGFPAVTLKGDNQVHGEIYEVDDETLKNCDRLEGIPTFYQREKVETSKGPAWIYTMEPRDLSEQRVIKSGVWERSEWF